MSQGPGPIPPGAGGQGGEQPDEEQIRAYLAQLRQADVAEIVAQAFSMLASGAEVKLGRRDARILIDTAAAVADAVGARVDDRLTQQMQQALTQLRSAQVDAEKQLDKLREEGKLPADEEGDVPEEAGAASAAEAGAADQEQRERPATSRLWIPGR